MLPTTGTLTPWATTANHKWYVRVASGKSLLLHAYKQGILSKIVNLGESWMSYKNNSRTFSWFSAEKTPQNRLERILKAKNTSFRLEVFTGHDDWEFGAGLEGSTLTTAPNSSACFQEKVIKMIEEHMVMIDSIENSGPFQCKYYYICNDYTDGLILVEQRTKDSYWPERKMKVHSANHEITLR